MIERVELQLHTGMSDDISVISPKQAVIAAEEKGYKAIAITDKNSVQSFYDVAWFQKKYAPNLKVIYGAILQAEGEMRTVLVKEQPGIKALYRLVSGKPITAQQRKSLLFGAHEGGKLHQAALSGEVSPTLAEGYDYIELYTDHQEPKYQAANRRLWALGTAAGIPVVAVSGCCYIEPWDGIGKVIVEEQKYGSSPAQARHLKSTVELLTECAYLGQETARAVVVDNPQMISDSIAHIAISPGDIPPFALPHGQERVAQIARENLESLYGKEPPEQFRQRLETELSLLEHNASMFLLCHEIAKEIHSKGTLTGFRGPVGATLLAYLLDISDLNPLPVHYHCPACHYVEFTQGDSGFDLPHKTCPHCGKTMQGDGHNIPFETAMGHDGQQKIFVDLNVPRRLQTDTMVFVKNLVGEDRVIHAGTINTYSNRIAQTWVQDYVQKHDPEFYPEEADQIAEQITNVKCGEGIHPGGLMLLPEGMEWEDVTPVRTWDDSRFGIPGATHMEYFPIMDQLDKVDVLGHDIPERLKNLFSATGTKPEDVDYHDPAVYALFEKLDTCGLPEFADAFSKRLLELLKHIQFSDLVRITGMAHGTRVWRENGEEYFFAGHPFRELIGDRDDIFLTLRRYGIDSKNAFAIMTAVRKGRFREPTPKNLEWVEMLRQAGVPRWYIQSMQKICYLFPKAHGAHYTKMAVTAAWFKVYHPEAFYKVTLESMGAEQYRSCSNEELEARLTSISEDDHSRRQEQQTLSLLLEARQRGFAE